MNVEQMAEAINECIGQEHQQTEASVKAIIWVMAMDPEVYGAFRREVNDQAADYQRQMGLAEDL